MKTYTPQHSRRPGLAPAWQRLAAIVFASALAVCLLGAESVRAAGNSKPADRVGHHRVLRAPEPVPSNPDVDYHPVRLTLRWKKFAEYSIPNCQGTFGEGTGSCGDNGGTSAAGGASPSLGTGWKLQWWPCASSPFPVPAECRGGWVAVQITAGNNWLRGVMPGRNSANLDIFDGQVPAYHSTTRVYEPPTPVGKPGERGGALYIDVESQCSNACYTITIHGELAFAQLARSFRISGYQAYGSGVDRAEHRFQASLDVFDTPSHPACNVPYLEGAGGCYGTFSAESTPPFRGRNGSIHWRRADGRFLESVISPHDGAFAGTVDRDLGALFVSGGDVLSWGTDIRSGSDISRIGERGGPLEVIEKAPAQRGRSAPNRGPT